MNKNPSQAEFIMAHFKKHPNQALALDDWSDEVARQYKEQTGKTAYHLRAIVRRLYWDGKLERVGRGVYKYDPDAVPKRRFLRFTAKQRREIRDRDEDRCVVCGLGPIHGVRVYVDFLDPNLPRTADIVNGAVFCARHSPSKSNLSMMDMIMMDLRAFSELAENAEGKEKPGFYEEIGEICRKYEAKL